MTEEKAQVVRVGIGRLYNLGNYEHVRYDITIEIPEGCDAADAVSKLRQILRGLKPLKAEGYTESRLRSLAAMTADERTEAIRKGATEESFTTADEWVSKREVRKAKRMQAIQLFNDLGGESIYTDHKELWDDNYDEDSREQECERNHPHNPIVRPDDLHRG